MSAACSICDARRATQDAVCESKKLTALNRERIAAEAIRAKELEAHGELTRRLQLQLDSHRHNEKELQLTIAKVRAEKCRIEAESAAAQSKLRLVEQGTEGNVQRHKRLMEDFRQRLLAKEHEIELMKTQIQALLIEKTEAAVKLAEKRKREETRELAILRLTDERDEAKQQLLTSADEIARLTVALSKKQSEIDDARTKSEELRIQLDVRTNDVMKSETEASQLSRTIEQLEISRLRLASWKRGRWDIQRRDLLLQTVFLEWKTQMLASKAVRTHKAKTAAGIRLQQVEKVHLKLSTKLATTKSTLQTSKVWLQSQQRDLGSWTELCAAQFTTLVTSRLRDQQANAMRVHSEEIEDLQRELQTQQKQQAELIGAAREEVAAANLRHKRRVDALVGHIQGLYQQKLRFVAFQGWKDIYLRNLVAETTHAVMVARAANSIVTSSRTFRVSPVHQVLAVATHLSRPSPKPTASELRKPQLTIDPHTREVEEDQWKRWRRVTPTESIAKLDEVRSRRSSITSSASRTSTTISTPTSHRSTVSKATSKRVEGAVEQVDGSMACRRASIV